MYVALSLVLSGCNRNANTSAPSHISRDSLKILSSNWEQLLKSGKREEARDSIYPYYRRARRTGDDALLLETSYNMGNANIDQPDSMFHYFDNILPLAKQCSDKKYLLAIYNAYGIYAINTALNYTESTYWFNKALQITYETGDRRRSCTLLCNMTWNSYFRNDSTGIENARRALSLANEIKDDYLIRFAKLSVSRMEYVCGNYEESLKYAQDALEATPDSPYPLVMMAKNLMALDKGEQAMYYLNQIIDNDHGQFKTLTMVEAYCLNAEYLCLQGLYEESLASWDKAAALSEELKDMNFIMTIYAGKADVYGKMGMPQMKTEWEGRCKAVSDTVFNIENERAYGLLMLRYANSVNEINVQKMNREIEKRNRRIWALVVILIAILAFSFIFVHERNKRYKALADKYYQDYQDELMKVKMSKTAQAASAESDRNAKLYEAMTRLMEDQQVWRDSDLSRDSLAVMLGTNTSYLTAMMSSCVGKTFNDYVNGFRIDEAIRLLSREGDETPAKEIAEQSGFNNLSTFYRVFQKTTGFPPSFYRKEIQNRRQQG